ncbi:golgin subfamily A member 6-like protein 26 [Linepithema humile]|uniref:golgin subfamily A member 6-like protein 26 n=1 Tax=Linepithema humile TaxID=83485 RepID=UPI00351EE2A8
MKRTENNIPLNQAEEKVCSVSSRIRRVIQDLKRKLKESQQVEASLSAFLEKETRDKEIQIKLNTTWESVEIITEYLNYISENLISFQQRALSTLCNDVIQKQQETIRQLQLNLENHVAQVENKSLLQEKDYKKQYQSRKNCENNWRISSTNCSCKRMNWRIAMLPAIRKEKCDTAISVEQLQIKLRLEEKKIQEALTEQNKLRKQLENSEYELKLQKNELTNSQAEKLTLVKIYLRHFPIKIL